jgi:large subunit ribosomal protein L17
MAKTLNRQALNLISSLVIHGSVTTTEARAKNLKREIERIISRSKDLDLTARRRILSLFPKTVSEKLLNSVIPQFKDRIGGYVRVIKLPPRMGDNAPLGRVELVEEIKKQKKEEKQEKPAKKTAAESKKPAKKGVKKGTKNAKNKSNKSKRS